MEHTHTDIQTAAMMFGAIADAGCVPLARVPTGRHDYIKMVLDCGAMGIVAPMVMDAAEARAIVAATKYPPLGNRSVGGGLHALNYGATAEDYFRKADDEILVIIQTEHIAGRRDRRRDLRRARASTPSSSARTTWPPRCARPTARRPSKQLMEDTLTRIREAAKRNGVPCGLHVLTAADALRRTAEGWQFIAVASELKMMLEGAADIVAGRSTREPPAPASSGEVLSGANPSRDRSATSRLDQRPDPLEPAPDDLGGVLRPRARG